MANAPFDLNKADEMFGYISKKLDENNGCGGTLRFTTEWLAQHYKGDGKKIESALDFIMRHGGFCDCEVLMNASKGEYWM